VLVELPGEDGGCEGSAVVGGTPVIAGRYIKRTYEEN